MDEVIEKAIAIQPTLGDAKVIQRWAGLRPKAKRRDPMIGAIPDLDGVYVATGAFKIGFGIANKIGEVMAKIVGGKDVEIPKSFTIEYHLS